MGTDNVPLIAFNRGIISKLGLARTDIKRTALSAEIQSNWMPRVLGSMMLRAGMEYIGNTKDNKLSIHLPFVFASNDTAIIELTDQVMRVRVDEALIARESVSTAIQNGDFGSATGWTDNDESGATSGVTGGVMSLQGTGFNRAIRTQTVTVVTDDQAKEHALNITVTLGPIILRLGTSSGSDDLIAETPLGAGVHSLAFTPGAATVYVQFLAVRKYTATLTSCQIASAGVMEISAPWAEDDLRKIRYDESADVIYLSASGYKQRKIERRGVTSWSLVEYAPEDGPFRNINVSSVSLTPSALSGDITLTASKGIFDSGHVGALFKIDSVGQRVNTDFTGANQAGNSIRVTGIGGQRAFTINIAGTFTATATLQQSVGEPGTWTDVATYTTMGSTSYNDGLDNQIVYYRLTVKSGNYTSGTVLTALVQNSSGSISGIVRVTGYTNGTTVSCVTLEDLGNTAASTSWYEGEWSNSRGYPSVPVLHEGRLFGIGKAKTLGSVSDAYESFDDDVEGDSGPINRSIGRGPVDDIMWALSLQRLCFGTVGSEWVARSSSFDEILTAANFNLKDPSTQGAANVNALKVDARGFFVQKSGTKLFQLIQDGSTFDYQSVDMMELAPEVGKPSILRVAAQRQPDTRIHCVRGDGRVAVLVNQPAEEVLCWVVIETRGAVEDVFTLPGEIEDKVYYTVRRTVNGNTVRYLERWAMESECQGGALNKQADSFVTYSGAATATINGLDHLEGEQVIVWADGKDYSPNVDGVQTTYTVAGGSITLNEEVEQAVVGLPYAAQYKSTKLAYAANGSTALGQEKRVDHLGLIFANIHHKGIRYGKNFDNMEPLPEIMRDVPVAVDTVFDDLDTGMFSFPGDWDLDSRLCLESQAPRPCTVLAAVLKMKTNA